MSPALFARELTAPGRGAIRVIEVSGRNAWLHVRERLRLPPEPEPLRVLRLGVAGSEEILDEAFVLVDGPERVELHLHGSPPVVARVLGVLGLPEPARVVDSGAGPLEASLEERAGAALQDAPSEAAARMLLDQVQGALRRELEAFVAGRGAGVLELRERGRIARYLLRPPTVLLVGAVNSGKSTLFNALVDRDRVVVAATAGTTRDAVRERIRLGDYAVDLVDTAGERGPEDEVEAAGQALARRLAGQADVRLRLVPWGSTAPDEVAGEVVVRTQVDRAPSRGDAAGRSAGWADGGGGGLEALAALADPEGARRVVEAIVLGTLALPVPAWTPRAGVPFLPALDADLGLAPELARSRVRAWLAAGHGPCSR